MNQPKKIESVAVEKLIPYASNSRTHSDEQLAQIAASIREFGFTNPVLVGKDNDIIAGHGRVLAARKLGLTEVPCLRLGYLTEAQKRAYVIADNKLALNAGWDEELLRVELNGLEEEGFDLGLTGFTEDEIAALLAVQTVEGNTDPNEIPEEPEQPTSVLGDVWTLGIHRLICGDSTSVDDVNRVIDVDRVDMCFTSPPYGVGSNAKLRDHYVRGSKRRDSLYKEHSDNPDQWHQLMAGWFDSIRPRADMVVCNVQMLADNKIELIRWVYDRREDLVDVVVWDKMNAAPQMQPRVMSNAFEFLFLFGGNGSRTVPFSDWHGTVQNIVRIDPRGKNSNSDSHRAVMPTELPHWVLSVLSPQVKTVVEPFCGTGTTIIACEQLQRKCMAIEITPSYVDIAVTRWQNFTGKQAVHESGKTFDEMKAERLK